MSVYRYLSFVFMLAFLPVLAKADINAELYKPYQGLLSDYLVEKNLPGGGLVTAFDYEAALAANGLNKRLSKQTARLESFDPKTLGGREESVAFWINAYNFFMIHQLLTERPDGRLVSSVWDYGGRINPFVDNVFQRKKFVVGGQTYSLDQIEKEILLGTDYANKGWKDARVHFAVNCAAVGCPPLRQAIYTADNVESMLAENTRRAFNTDHHLRVDGNILYLTELFKWYEQDFVEAAGSSRAFVQKWAEPSVADKAAETSDIEYIDYDWALNKPANFAVFR